MKLGLTHESTGRRAADAGLVVSKQRSGDLIVALAGNPNVGKSTVFNALTGLNQHTGNWPGKTVATAQGVCSRDGRDYILVDLPGCYSLLAHSAEEEVARDFLCFGGPEAVVVVCDATCLERNLNLVLQTLEITNRAVVCVNLMDEARRKGVSVDLEVLSQRLGAPVVAATARSGAGLDELLRMTARQARQPRRELAPVTYSPPIEQAVRLLSGAVRRACGERVPARWAALRLLDTDASLLRSLDASLGFCLSESLPVKQALADARTILSEAGVVRVQDDIVSALVATAESMAAQTVRQTESPAARRDRKLDRLLTSRRTGIPLMLLLLAGVFWLTISGANYPSQLLSQGFGWLEVRLDWALVAIGLPDVLRDVLVNGVYRVLAWVVAVMLPPMAIFFPLFTLLEDLGYLPRVAFNLDKSFQKCRACGKQALTMAMVYIIMLYKRQAFVTRSVCQK